MKKKIILFCLALIYSSGVVLSQNYTNAISGTDTEPLSLQKIHYKLNNGISVTNFGLLCVTNITVRTTANATAYTANDALCNSETSTNLPSILTNVNPTLTGKIVKVRMNNTTNTAVGTFRVWFYTSTNITQQADNAAYIIYTTNAPSRLGYIDVQLNAGTDCAYGFNATDQLPICTPTGNLFYNVQTLSAFTPIGGMTNFLEVTVQPYK